MRVKPQWSQELGRIVNTKRFKAKSFAIQCALRSELLMYEERSLLPEPLRSEVDACIASGKWGSRDPLMEDVDRSPVCQFTLIDEAAVYGRALRLDHMQRSSEPEVQ